jgi:hypothetical protein
MVAIGLGLAWAGYTVFMWGYCLVRDYNVTIPDLFKTTWPGVSGAAGTPSRVPYATGTAQKPGTTTAGGRG